MDTSPGPASTRRVRLVGRFSVRALAEMLAADGVANAHAGRTLIGASNR